MRPSKLKNIEVTTDLPSSEWDFRRVPKDFTWTAIAWEYARQTPGFIPAWNEWLNKKVHDWIQNGPNPMDAEFTADFLSIQSAIVKRRYCGNSKLERALFDLLPAPLRSHWVTVQKIALISSDFPSPILESGVITDREFLNDLPCNCEILHKSNASLFQPHRRVIASQAFMELSPSVLSQPRVDDENYYLGAFSINFGEFADKTIISAFARWLSESRPRWEAESQPTRTPKERNAKIGEPPIAMLKRLSALRLQNAGHSWDEAESVIEWMLDQETRQFERRREELSNKCPGLGDLLNTADKHSSLKHLDSSELPPNLKSEGKRLLHSNLTGLAKKYLPLYGTEELWERALEQAKQELTEIYPTRHSSSDR